MRPQNAITGGCPRYSSSRYSFRYSLFPSGGDADYDAEFAGLAAEGSLLNEYIVAGRYPGDIAPEQIGPAEAREALKAAQAIRTHVRRAMKKQGLSRRVASLVT